MSAAAVALNGLVALPLLGAAFALLAGRRGSTGAGVGVAVVASVATLAWSAWLAALTSSSLGETDVDVAWVASLGVRWHLGADGISVPLVLMTTLVTACCLASLLRSPEGDDSRVPLAALLLLIEGGVLGCFLALDMVLFFVFFEVALIPMWFVIDTWGDGTDPAGRRRAATRFLVFTVLGSAVMLVGFLLVGSSAGTFDIAAIAAGRSTYDAGSGTAVAASVLVAIGLAVKTPLWPVHIWLPDAHSKAPTVGSVMLAAVLLKLGTYGFVRFWMPVTDTSRQLLVPVVAALATVGIIYGALACLAQTDLKRLIAYSSVGHMGFVVLAVTTFTVGGVQAAVYASVAHGLITGLLFFVAGAVKERYATTDLGRLSVLYGRVPRLAAMFAFAAMASLGLPGLAGFWGEMLAIRAALSPAEPLPADTFVVLAVVAALGVILTSAYFLAVLRSMLQGPQPDASAAPVEIAAHPADQDPGTRGASVATVPSSSVALGVVSPSPERTDVRPLEWLVWAPLVVATVVFGVAPGLLLTPVGHAALAYFGGR